MSIPDLHSTRLRRCVWPRFVTGTKRARSISKSVFQRAGASQELRARLAILVLPFFAVTGAAWGAGEGAVVPDRSASPEFPNPQGIQRITVVDLLPGTNCPGCVSYIRDTSQRIMTIAGIDYVIFVSQDQADVAELRSRLEGEIGRTTPVHSTAELDLADRFGVADALDPSSGVPVTLILVPGASEPTGRVGKSPDDFTPFTEIANRLDELTRTPNLAQYNLQDHQPALKGFDPVAYHHNGEARMGLSRFRSRYRGIDYYFANDANRTRFAADPDRYLPAYGGWCATAMAEGRMVDIDPANFKISDGRLFLFYKGWLGDARKEWDRNEPDLMRRADRHWKRIAPAELPWMTR